MKTATIVLPAICLCLGSAPLSAQVFTSEFFSDPVSEGWVSAQQYCEPTLSIEDGWYHQRLSLDACPPGPQGGHDSYRRSLEAFNGNQTFFVEFRLQTDGDRSEIPYGAPAVVAMGHFFGVIYHITVARDVVKFARDVELPIWFIEISRLVPHTFRVELRLDRYAFYIDADLIDEGVAEGPFPAHDSRMNWQGNSWELPCHNAWDYIRYGRIPEPASGDFNSDATVGLFDYYFVHDCLTKDGPGIFGGPWESTGHGAGPGCRAFDFDPEPDGDVDLLDFAEFANLFTGAHP